MPHDMMGGSDLSRISWRVRMGPNHRKGDSLRHWTHWKSTDNVKSLLLPFSKDRRQSSWDDAGELYPPDHAGPDLLLDLELPPGLHRVALYFVNIDCLECPTHWKTSDGLPLPNRFRD